MRDIFTEIFETQPVDPMVSARRGGRVVLRKRFYKQAQAAETADEGGCFPLALDGKPVKTPARRTLAAPSRALADLIALEWNAQQETINPARMPLTRLANAVIDAVADRVTPVADEVVKYIGSDLLFYRADTPPGLIARQARHWDPVLAWSRDGLGAHFILAQGVIHTAQPDKAIEAARAQVPANAADLNAVWALGAIAAITTLTGSGLLALALRAGQIEADAAWAAAHVDEDWQMEYWGRDEDALTRRANRFAEFGAAVTVLKHTS